MLIAFLANRMLVREQTELKNEANKKNLLMLLCQLDFSSLHQIATIGLAYYMQIGDEIGPDQSIRYVDESDKFS